MDKSLYDVEKVNEKLKNIKSLEDLTGKDGIIQMMIKSTVERLLKAEQEAHLGYEPYRKKDKIVNPLARPKGRGFGPLACWLSLISNISFDHFFLGNPNCFGKIAIRPKALSPQKFL